MTHCKTGEDIRVYWKEWIGERILIYGALTLKTTGIEKIEAFEVWVNLDVI